MKNEMNLNEKEINGQIYQEPAEGVEISAEELEAISGGYDTYPDPAFGFKYYYGQDVWICMGYFWHKASIRMAHSENGVHTYDAFDFVDMKKVTYITEDRIKIYVKY